VIKNSASNRNDAMGHNPTFDYRQSVEPSGRCQTQGGYGRERIPARLQLTDCNDASRSGRTTYSRSCGGNSVHIGFQQPGVQRYFRSSSILELSNIEQRSRIRKGKKIHHTGINGDKQECSASNSGPQSFRAIQPQHQPLAPRELQAPV